MAEPGERDGYGMKRMLACLTALVCVFALTVPALADVIWTPDDDFFKAHQSECRQEERNYYINSRNGYVDLVSSPVSEKTVARAKNGAEVSVGFTYEKNGMKWGVVSYNVGENKKDWLEWDKESGIGWVKMSDLLLVYDEQSFEAEHGKEFTEYDGSFDKLCSSKGQRVIVWSYPGSGVISADLKTLDQTYGALKPSAMWMDANGQVWGKIDYYKAARGWACLSDPADENLPVTEHSYTFYPAASGTDGAKAQTKTADAAETGDSGVTFAVAAVCGVTALLLVSLRKKKTE